MTQGKIFDKIFNRDKKFTERGMDREKDKSVNTVASDLIPNKEKLCYGIGGLMDGGAVALMSCIMLKYMTSAMGKANQA